MYRIGPSTALFLYDFRAGDLMGPMKAVGEPALDIDPEAWHGRFPAHLRFAPLECGATNLTNGVATLSINKSRHGPIGAGELSQSRARELMDFLLA